MVCSSYVLPIAETLPLCRGGGVCFQRWSSSFKGNGPLRPHRIGVQMPNWKWFGLANYLLGCFVFSIVCPQCSTASLGHCFCSSLNFPFNWCLNFKLFSLQAGLQRFTWIMGTTSSQQAAEKGSVRKTLLVIKLCLRFMDPVQWAWLSCLSV